MKTLALLTIMALALGGGEAIAKTCLDPKGKAIKCPAETAQPAGNRCINSKTRKFVKCGSPNAEPVPQN